MRIISTRLLILFTLLLTFNSLKASFDGIKTYVEQDVEVCPEENFLLPVFFLSQSQYSVDSFQLVLDYNPAVLQFIDTVGVQAAFNEFGVFNVNHFAGRITLAFYSQSLPVKIGSGILLNLKFKPLQGTTTLNWFTPACAYYFANQTPLEEYENGSVIVLPKMGISMIQLPEEICPEDSASVYARVTGGTPPYQYKWEGSPLQPLSDTIARNLIAYENYKLIITDSKGCKHDTTFSLKVRKLNTVKITATPDTVFISNPSISFTVINESDPAIINYFWRFGDGDSINTPNPDISHFYFGAKEFAKQGGQQYAITLTITNEFGCDTTFNYTLKLMEAPIFVPNVFTPNGDGANDVFKLVQKDNKDKIINYEYLRVELQVLNRWGKKIYSSDNYQSDWDGDNAPDGVYFYVIKATGYYKTDTYKGSVHILR